MGQPVVSWIEHHAARTPDRTALVRLHRGRELSYREFATRIRAVSWSLAERYGRSTRPRHWHGSRTPASR